MEKNKTITVKGVFKFLVIIVLIVLAFNLITNITDANSWFSKLFTPTAPINVNAFEGANTNYNVGLTKYQINEQKDNANCPTCSDKYDKLYIQDYEDIVCFYKETKDEIGNTIYPNIVFVKTSQGLKFNGALNITGHAHYGWFGAGYSYTVDQKFSEKPVYVKQKSVSGGWARTNLVLFDCDEYEDYIINEGFSGFISSIVKGCSQLYQNVRHNQVQAYIIQNIYPYFLTFSNQEVEIIQDELTANGDFNAFYDYIYRCTKLYDFGTSSMGSCSVDVSDLTVCPLPDSEQEKYVLDATVSPVVYFKLYNCKTILNIDYQYMDKATYLKDNKDLKDNLVDEPFETLDKEPESLSTVIVKLKTEQDLLNSTIKNIVKDNPVQIDFYDSDNKLYRSINFTSDMFLNKTASFNSAFKNGSYTYRINSNVLLFDSYNGSFSIDGYSNISFKFTYLDGQVMVIYQISPASNDVDISSVNLANKPVKIVLNGLDGQGTYQFEFNDNSMISTNQSQLMKTGSYRYTNLSEKLIFGTTTGVVEIKPNNRIFNFSFAIKLERSDLAFSVAVNENAYSGDGRFMLSGDSSSVGLLASKLGKTNYSVNIYFFDNQGNVVLTLTHTHGGNGGCSDSWTKSNILTEGTTYTVQMQYANKSDSSASDYISYTSSTFSINYKANTSYTFTYSCVEVV